MYSQSFVSSCPAPAPFRTDLARDYMAFGFQERRPQLTMYPFLASEMRPQAELASRLFNGYSSTVDRALDAVAEQVGSMANYRNGYSRSYFWAIIVKRENLVYKTGPSMPQTKRNART